MNQGHLQSAGIRFQRRRVRQFVASNDPIHRNMHWHQVLSRRSYSVLGPNSLWHIDGHHCLIRWRFVIHGGIDGYSHSIVYLQCTTNKAKNVFAYFRKAMREYGIPSRVCSRILWCATSWCPKGEQGVVVTLPVGLPIIRE